jgi:4-hydroxybenzoate polyprenyltransferase
MGKLPIAEWITSFGILSLLNYSYRLQGIDFSPRVFVSGLLCALFVYVFDHEMDRKNGRSKSLRASVGALGAAALVSLFWLSPGEAGLIAAPLLGGILYSPATLGIKKIPFLKSFFVTTLIVFPVTFLPAAGMGDALFTKSRGILFAILWVVVFNNAVLFDVLDSGEDRARGIRTLPNEWGPRLTHGFLAFLILGAGVLLWASPPFGIPSQATLGPALIWGLVTQALIGRPWPRRTFLYLLDGGLFFPFLIFVARSGF